EDGVNLVRKISQEALKETGRGRSVPLGMDLDKDVAGGSVDGDTLYQAVERSRFCDNAVIDLPQRMDRRGRQAHLSMRFGT
ncbi:hypothetical protein E3H11_44065, partial [Bradyrhizobium brasilense]|uniref:hypothetical protein n=1 Tax=Bradyrhizobium brasilense TaxID=1419277 RepID=UPI001456A4F7